MDAAPLFLRADEKEFDFTALLHTYFRCDEVEKVGVKGLKGARITDKVHGTCLGGGHSATERKPWQWRLYPSLGESPHSVVRPPGDAVLADRDLNCSQGTLTRTRGCMCLAVLGWP